MKTLTDVEWTASIDRTARYEPTKHRRLPPRADDGAPELNCYFDGETWARGNPDQYRGL